MATVFFHRIEIIAGDLGVSQGPLLGHALAHEVGHLLLGRGYHARSGLMRCPWRRRDLKNAAWGRLWLSGEEAKQILSRFATECKRSTRRFSLERLGVDNNRKLSGSSMADTPIRGCFRSREVHRSAVERRVATGNWISQPPIGPSSQARRQQETSSGD